MKKYLFGLILLTLTVVQAPYLMAQNLITQEQLTGKWRLTSGSGEDFDPETVGSIFNFAPQGELIMDLAPIENERTPDNHGLGTWALTKNQIKLNMFDENKEVVDIVTMDITTYKDNQLTVNMKGQGIQVVFEKIPPQ
jgi:hypothetical protein